MSNIHSEHWAIDQKILEAFVFHRLDKEETETLTAHLEQCVECSHRVQDEKDFIAGIRRYGWREMKNRLRQQIQSNPEKRYDWTQAASIAAAIILMFGVIFAIRSIVDLGKNKNRTREIVLNSDTQSQRAFWIAGRLITNTRQFKGTLSERSNKFFAKKGNAAQTVFIHHAMLSKLPLAQHTDEESCVQSFLERTPQGLQITLYMDSGSNSSIAGVEPITEDSLIIFCRGRQIAFHIPGGWAGRI